MLPRVHVVLVGANGVYLHVSRYVGTRLNRIPGLVFLSTGGYEFFLRVIDRHFC